MKSEFVIMLNGQIVTYDRWEDIPASFDHLIKFNPWMPPPPHDEQQHAEIDNWMPRLQELLKRERGTRP